MPATYYPAVIDRSASGFGVTFPDFPGCVASGATVGEACIEAEKALALHIEAMVKDKDAIPQPSELDAIESVEGADDVARVMVRAEVAPKIERVLVSMDSNLLRAIDAVAPNRSAFIADAARAHLGGVIAAGIVGQGDLATMSRADLEREYGLKRAKPSKPAQGGETIRGLADRDHVSGLFGSKEKRGPERPSVLASDLGLGASRTK